jgi:hypothetical protein
LLSRSLRDADCLKRRHSQRQLGDVVSSGGALALFGSNPSVAGVTIVSSGGTFEWFGSNPIVAGAQFRGGATVTDPGVPFGGGATLGFAADGNRHGGTLPITPGTAATAALFGHSIAGSLLAGAGAYGNGLTAEAAASAGQHPHLTPPHG